MTNDIVENTSSNLTLLHNINYATCALNMKQAPTTERGWGIVMDQQTMPQFLERAEVGRSAAERADFEIRHARAVSLLFNAMTEEIRSQLDDLEHPTELWKNFKEEYSTADSETGTRRLTNCVLALRPVPGKPIAKFSATAITLRRELKDTKEAISDHTFRKHLLTYVPDALRHLADMIGRKK
ncbi:hypothetical protein BZA77DRAFT_388490 [Pyronema omphalodes]|nr:hypothetical protein BZA77DRAFT_388490 [Pyronema omphalodes]